MALLDQFKYIEQCMETAFLRKRFDTFNLLAADRLRLLQKALQSEEKDELFELAQASTARWVDLLELGVNQGRAQQQKTKRIQGVYGRTTSAGAGRYIRKTY